MIARWASGEQRAATDSEGKFSVGVPTEALTIRLEGKYVVPVEKTIGSGEATENLRIEIEYIVPPVHESVVIQASALDPSIDRRDDAVYKNTLFSRDDQVFQTLNAGINADQHEGVESHLRFAALVSISITSGARCTPLPFCSGYFIR